MSISAPLINSVGHLKSRWLTQIAWYGLKTHVGSANPVAFPPWKCNPYGSPGRHSMRLLSDLELHFRGVSKAGALARIIQNMPLLESTTITPQSWRSGDRSMWEMFVGRWWGFA
jgi:hypothetical protein